MSDYIEKNGSLIHKDAEIEESVEPEEAEAE